MTAKKNLSLKKNQKSVTIKESESSEDLSESASISDSQLDFKREVQDQMRTAQNIQQRYSLQLKRSGTIAAIDQNKNF